MTTMTAPNRGYKAVTSLIRASRHPRVCSDCINKAQHRNYAVAAATLSTSEGTSTSPHISQIPPVTQTGPQPAYQINSGIVLSRPPLLTPSLTPFENSFFLYQKRLNERLSMPFTRYFYHKPDSPQDVDWKKRVKHRNGVASRDVGGYQAYGAERWNDEVLVGDELAKPQSIVDALMKDVEVEEVAEDSISDIAALKVDKPSPRHTEADKNNDSKRLDRKLARTLYLCVQGPDGEWMFPQGPLIGREGLHRAAERIIVQAAGINMNTWLVGHAPIGHRVVEPRFSADKTSIEQSGSKTFFMKGRIMTGQADLTGNLFGLKDFKWLTRQELAKVTSTSYYSRIVNMLGDR